MLFRDKSNKKRKEKAMKTQSFRFEPLTADSTDNSTDTICRQGR